MIIYDFYKDSIIRYKYGNVIEKKNFVKKTYYYETTNGKVELYDYRKNKICNYDISYTSTKSLNTVPRFYNTLIDYLTVNHINLYDGIEKCNTLIFDIEVGSIDDKMPNYSEIILCISCIEVEGLEYDNNILTK